MFKHLLKSAAAAVTVLMLHAAAVQAQSAIDPALLSQLSPENQKKALRALGEKTESSDAPQVSTPQSAATKSMRSALVENRQALNAPAFLAVDQPPLFAYGTVFTRVSAREHERAANRRAAADLRESLVGAATQGLSTSSGNATANAAVLDLVQRLETVPAVGRVVIEADPVLLSARPGADFLLEPGDEIFVPKRPNAVAVTGQVLSPGSLAFVSGAAPEDYILQAGGYALAADTSRSFIVLPNGTARPLHRSFWHTRAESIPPGSVIIVPRDVAPFTALILTERITSILSNLALSAAALVTINR